MFNFQSLFQSCPLHWSRQFKHCLRSPFRRASSHGNNSFACGWCHHCMSIWFQWQIWSWNTHGPRYLTTLLVKYFNDYLDIQGCGRGGGWVTCFKVGDVFSYVLDITYANSRQKISSDMTCGMSRKKLQLLLK